MSLVIFLLIVISIIDIKTRMIPDILTLPCISIGFYSLGLEEALRGILVGGGLLFVVSFIGLKILGRPSFGGGDIKLMAMFGSLLGWKIALATFAFAPLLAIPEGFLSQRPVTFAKYISLACVLSIWIKAL